MSSLIYQYLINVIYFHYRGPGAFMHVSMWEHCAFNNKIFCFDSLLL